MLMICFILETEITGLTSFTRFHPRLKAGDFNFDSKQTFLILINPESLIQLFYLRNPQMLSKIQITIRYRNVGFIQGSNQNTLSETQ